MSYAIIIRPLIGALIGYVTNWIAVKMMFRPLKPIKIGKFILPFTPGIIPKNRERIANSIGNVISNNLITEDALKDSLLSNYMQSKIEKNVIDILDKIKKSNSTIENEVNKIINRTSYDMAIAYIIDYLSNSIFETVKESNIGLLVSNEIASTISEKVNNSMLGALGGNAIASWVSKDVELKVNDYINDNGYEIISKMVEDELYKIVSSKLCDIFEKIESSEIDLVEIAMNTYRKVILAKLSDVLNIINISKVVTDKINEMDMLELEKMILGIMKKELNALVNLGAVIGFALGLLNLTF